MLGVNTQPPTSPRFGVNRDKRISLDECGTIADGFPIVGKTSLTGLWITARDPGAIQTEHLGDVSPAIPARGAAWRKHVQVKHHGCGSSGLRITLPGLARS